MLIPKKLRDVSFGAAKRYDAHYELRDLMSKSELKAILEDVIATIRAKDEYFSEASRAKWSGTLAHVVWLEIYLPGSTEVEADCLSVLWIDPELPEDARPASLLKSQVVNCKTLSGKMQLLWHPGAERLRRAQVLAARANTKPKWRTKANERKS